MPFAKDFKSCRNVRMFIRESCSQSIKHDNISIGRLKIKLRNKKERFGI